MSNFNRFHSCNHVSSFFFLSFPHFFLLMYALLGLCFAFLVPSLILWLVFRGHGFPAAVAHRDVYCRRFRAARFPSCAHLPPLSVLSCLISPNTEVVKMFTRSFPFSSSLNYQNAARSIREQVRPANFFCILQVSAANAQLLIVNSRVKETRSPDCANLTRTKGLYREGYLLICTAKGHSV